MAMHKHLNYAAKHEYLACVLIISLLIICMLRGTTTIIFALVLKARLKPAIRKWVAEAILDRLRKDFLLALQLCRRNFIKGSNTSKFHAGDYFMARR